MALMPRSLLAFSVLIFCIPALSQVAADLTRLNVCGQEEVIQGPLIVEAEAKRFNVRRVEISGNASIRHREFVKRLRGLNEGDIFTRQSLEMAVRKIAKMKSIDPITLRNVELRLDREFKDVDILFCVKERPKR